MNLIGIKSRLIWTISTNRKEGFTMKKIKKIAASIMAVAAMATSMVGISASADSTPSNVPTITVAPASTGTWHFTPTRSKGSDTRAYVYVSSGTISPCVGVFASDGSNCTRNNLGQSVSSIPCSIGISYTINNDVKWHGAGYTSYNSAKLGVISPYTNQGGTCTLSWAPDSSTPTKHP